MTLTAASVTDKAATTAKTPTPAQAAREAVAKANAERTPEQRAALGKALWEDKPIEEVTPAETPEAKAKREGEEKAAADKKIADDAAAAAKAKEEADKKEGKTAPAKSASPAKAAPAKRVIKVAKADLLPSDPMAAAVEKLTGTVEKLVTKAAETPKVATLPDLKLNPREERQMKALELLPELFPDTPEYKGIADRARKFLADRPAFEAKFDEEFKTRWETRNGDKYDTEVEKQAAFTEAREAALAPELAKFRDKFKIDYDDDDMVEARAELRVNPVRKSAEAAEKTAAEFAEQKRLEAVTPLAEEAKQDAITDLRANLETSLGSEFKDVLKEDGTVNEEALSADPDGDIVSEILGGAVTRAKNFAEAVTRAFNGAETPLIKQVFQFCQAQEKALAGSVDEHKRPFLPRMEFLKLSKAEQAQHWTLEPDTIIALGNDIIMASAKEDIAAEKERTTKRITRRGLVKTTAAAAPAAAAKPNSPSSTDPVVAGTGKGTVVNKKTIWDD